MALPQPRSSQSEWWEQQTETTWELAMWPRRVLDPEPTLRSEDATAEPVGHDPALASVDDALAAFASRDLVSGAEAIDRLLDVRNALVAATALRELEMSS